MHIRLLMLETVRAIGIAPLAVHDSFIVPASQKGRLMGAMEDAIRCGNTAPQTPCGNTPHFFDSFSSLLSTTSPKRVPQYGMEREMDGREGGGSGMDRPAELLSR
jgi:hypothetical protein